jgi:hypothetical protein
MEPCRICGTSLKVQDHRYFNAFSTTSDGTPTGYLSLTHAKCPSCGEPKPLSHFKDTWYASIVSIGITLFVNYFVVLNVWHMFDHTTLNDLFYIVFVFPLFFFGSLVFIARVILKVRW